LTARSRPKSSVQTMSCFWFDITDAVTPVRA
jgi:hypothetical protein